MHILRTDIRFFAWVALTGVFMYGCGYASPAELPDPIGYDEPVALPPPLTDVPPPDSGLQKAVLAAGCFWSVEAVFEHVKGVHEVITGYSGGTAETARYDLVAVRGTTGHAEVVEITFDPTVVSYGQLLRIFFSAAHDPTQVDRQDPDFGPAYRSHIFYTTEDQWQWQVAQAYIDQIDASGAFSKPIATRLDPLEAFYRAEEFHQDFVANNPVDLYVRVFSLPKLATFADLFPDFYRPSGSQDG